MRANNETFPKKNAELASTMSDMEVNPLSKIFRSLRQVVEEGPEEWSINTADRKRFSLHVANTPELRERAFRLGEKIYRKMGYTPSKNGSELLYSQFDAKADTFIMLVRDAEGRDVATMTLVFDSEKDGLPLDDIYRDEADRLRARGRRLVEIVRLAVDNSARGCREVVVHLFNFAYIYSWHVMSCDDFVITVNPRHVPYYRRLLGFEPLGEVKPCPKVQDAPAVMLRLSLAYVSKKIRTTGGQLSRGQADRSLYPFAFAPEAEPFLASFMRHRHRPMEVEEMSRLGLEQPCDNRLDSQVFGREIPTRVSFA